MAKSKTGELDDLYKRYCFQTPSVKAQFRFFAVGTKVSGISKSNIGKITIALPPVDEQSAIATLLSDMDAELAALEAKLAKARDLKQGMMQGTADRADTPGLTAAPPGAGRRVASADFCRQVLGNRRRSFRKTLAFS